MCYIVDAPSNPCVLYRLWKYHNCFPRFFSFLFSYTSSPVQHSWWHSVGRTGQHHTRCPGYGIRCRWQGNGPRSRTRSMMTSSANDAATSSIRETYTIIRCRSVYTILSCLYSIFFYINTAFLNGT